MAKADGEVAIRMTAADAGVVEKWLEIKKKGPEALEAAMTSASSKGKAGAQSLTAAFKTFGKEIAGSASSLLGLGGKLGIVAAATAGLRSEWDKFLQLSRSAAIQTEDLAAAQQELATNLRDASNLQTMQDAIFRARLGVPPANLLRAFSAGISAAGSLGEQQVRELVLAAAKARPKLAELDPEGFNAVVGGALELNKIDPSLSPLQSLGFLFNFQKAVRGVELQQLAQFGIPAIRQTMERFPGTNLQFAASQFAALTQAAGDPGQMRSATGLINMFEKFQDEAIMRGAFRKRGSLEEFFAALNNNVSKEGEKLRQDIVGVLDVAPGAEITDPTRRRLAAAAEEFNVGGEARTRQFIRGFFSKEPSLIQREAATAMEKIAENATLAALGLDDMNRELAKLSEQQASRLRRSLRDVQQTAGLSPGLQIAGAAVDEEDFRKALISGRQFAIQARLNEMIALGAGGLVDFGETGLPTARIMRGMLSQQAGQRRGDFFASLFGDPVSMILRGGVPNPAALLNLFREPTQQGKADAASLEAAAEEFGRQISIMRLTVESNTGDRVPARARVGSLEGRP